MAKGFSFLPITVENVIRNNNFLVVRLIACGSFLCMCEYSP